MRLSHKLPRPGCDIWVFGPLSRKLTMEWQEQERGGGGGREHKTERECDLHAKLASLAEKGNGKNFNVILFLLTGAMS